MKRQKSVDGSTKTKQAAEGMIKLIKKNATVENEAPPKQALLTDEIKESSVISGGINVNGESLEEYNRESWVRVGVVDEQMSWGSTWMPFWDVEYMGEACGDLFSDVMWDDDIWNLRHLDNVPNP